MPSVAGLHLCALTPDLSVEETVSVFERAAARGVALNPLTQYTSDPVRKLEQTGFVLGYGAIATERIDDGLRRFAECLPE